MELPDLERVGYIFWIGFYAFFDIIPQDEFEINYGKAIAITITPSLLLALEKLFFPDAIIFRHLLPQAIEIATINLSCSLGFYLGLYLFNKFILVRGPVFEYQKFSHHADHPIGSRILGSIFQFLRMKKYLPYIILFILSILFYWISSRSYALQSGELESLELFRLFRGISNLIALFVPLMLFVFYMLTSGLMFTLLDEKFNPQKQSSAITISFIPILLNCLIYLLVLYGVEEGGTLSEMLNQPSFMGLGLSDMEEVSYIFWLGFYLFFAIMLWHEFELGVGKAIAISCIPTLLVVLGRWLAGIF